MVKACNGEAQGGTLSLTAWRQSLSGADDRDMASLSWCSTTRPDVAGSAGWTGLRWCRTWCAATTGFSHKGKAGALLCSHRKRSRQPHGRWPTDWRRRRSCRWEWPAPRMTAKSCPACLSVPWPVPVPAERSDVGECPPPGATRRNQAGQIVTAIGEQGIAVSDDTLPDRSGLEQCEWLARYPRRPRRAASSLRVKRALDVLVVLAASPVWLPLLAICFLAVKLQDPRTPALFSQLRTGLGGERFRVHKFRTMVRDAEQLKESLRHLNLRTWPDFKVENDPRVTRVGRLLRGHQPRRAAPVARCAAGFDVSRRPAADHPRADLL